MNIRKVLNDLENSWEREDILLKIKNGHKNEEITNEFLKKNEVQIKELNTLLKPNDIDLLNQVEQLLTCEAELINKINNLNLLRNNEKHHKINKKKTLFYKRVPNNRLSLFMINWSNRFVVIALLTISAMALTKQAWA